MYTQVYSLGHCRVSSSTHLLTCDRIAAIARTTFHADAPLLVRRLVYLDNLTPLELIALLIMAICHQKQPSS